MAPVGGAQNTRSIKPILRSCGERTTDHAVRLLARIVPREDIAIIREVPFEKALRATYETALAAGREWTFVMDADVLPSPDKLGDAFALCEVGASDLFVFRGLVLDKFFGWPREVGNYFYRTELLGQALDLIPEAGTRVRPEFSTINAMRDRGHRVETITDLIYGIHDFEQFFSDLFRKGYVYAGKHPGMDILMAAWQRQAAEDPDFRIMRAGAVAHRRHGVRVEIDARRFPRDLNDVLSKFGLVEKDPLPEPEVSPERVDAAIDSWQPSPVFHAYEAFLGVWPQRLSDLSLARIRPLLGWMRRSRARGSLAAELGYLLRASIARRREYGGSEVELGTSYYAERD